MQFSIYQDSRQGARRSNQDRVAHAWSRDAVLLVVADGMGGHLHGELAAQIAIRSLTESFRDHATPRIHDPARFLDEALHRAHNAINDTAHAQRLREIPHTTCVVALIQDDALNWAHTGDSRLYLVRHGRVLVRSEDHSTVAQMVRDGVLTEAAAATHPDRNRVTNCLGGYLPPEVSLTPALPLQDGDRLLLCSDGLWGPVNDTEIVDMLVRKPLEDAVRGLLDEAERRAGMQCDNLSAVTLRWGEASDADVTISTRSLPEDGFTSRIGQSRHPFAAALPRSDEEIERAVAALQKAIHKKPAP
jgi:serine/threonine protein phosphatase PrpC